MFKKSHNLISVKNNENLDTRDFLFEMIEYLIKICIKLKPFTTEGRNFVEKILIRRYISG